MVGKGLINNGDVYSLFVSLGEKVLKGNKKMKNEMATPMNYDHAALVTSHELQPWIWIV